MMIWGGRIQQSGELCGNLFASAGRPVDLVGLGHVHRHGYADAIQQQLDTFCNRVYQFDLLVEVLVEKQVATIAVKSPFS
jgi:hypothetical protein